MVTHQIRMGFCHLPPGDPLNWIGCFIFSGPGGRIARNDINKVLLSPEPPKSNRIKPIEQKERKKKPQTLHIDGEQLEKNCGKCEIIRRKFDGRPQRSKQSGFLGCCWNSRLFPLGETLSGSQKATTGFFFPIFNQTYFPFFLFSFWFRAAAHLK